MNWWESLASYIETNGGCRPIYRDDGDPNDLLYLKRYYIYKTPFGECMLHQFFKGDAGPLHDHPAATCGIILSEGYTEMVADSVEDAANGNWIAIERRAGDFSSRPVRDGTARSLHKVVLRPGTAGNVWTLFFMGRRKNKSAWGFQEKDKWVHFSEFYRRQGIPQPAHDEYKGWLFPKRKA